MEISEKCIDYIERHERDLSFKMMVISEKCLDYKERHERDLSFKMMVISEKMSRLHRKA